MDLGDLLRSDELFLHVSHRRWFGPRRLAVQGGGALALVQDRASRPGRIAARLGLSWLGVDPLELHLVPQGGGAALVARRRLLPRLNRGVELTDANGQVIARCARAWCLGRGIDIRDRNGAIAGRVRGDLGGWQFRVASASDRVIGALSAEGMGWVAGPQPGWRIVRQGGAGQDAMLILLAAAFAVHLRWFDR